MYNTNNVNMERDALYVRGLSGLQNIGNTCYMNSILQCLSAISVFRSYICSDDCLERLHTNVLDKINKDKRKENMLEPDDIISIEKDEYDRVCNDTVTLGLNKLLSVMWQQNANVCPHTFKQIIGRHNEMFRGFSQNDSQELLNMILDVTHEELQMEVVIRPRNVSESVYSYINITNECSKYINSPHVPDEMKKRYLAYLNEYSMRNINDKIIGDAFMYWAKYTEKSYSIITDLFAGLFCSKIHCKTCNGIGCSFEPFTMLQLSVHGDSDATLHELINSFCQEELLNGSNQYFCSNCNKKVDASKKMYIWSLPNVLVIQLKRFKNNCGIPTKIESKITFPIDDLDMKNYTSELNHYNKTKYDLVAISEHRGTCDFGHYVAYCKNGINNKWYEFNDSHIYHVPIENLEKEIITSDAYILFYVKKMD